jgi:hypothetical protein
MTRTLLTLSLFFFLSFIASAQFKKGDILLGGSLNFSNNKSTFTNLSRADNSTYGVINISAGKAIGQNTVFGANLIYSQSHNDNDDGTTDQYHTYGFGIFYRIYKNLGKDFFLFGQAGAGYNGVSSWYVDSMGSRITSDYSNNVNIYFTPGISYKITKKLFLELGLPNIFAASYGWEKNNQTTSSRKTTSFSISTSLNGNPLNYLNIGFQLIL